MDRRLEVKDLHRLIVGSATYRQSSKVSPELLARDPYNRLLARGSRLRVEGEVVRDIQLAASGLLNPAMGGRSSDAPGARIPVPAPGQLRPVPLDRGDGPESLPRGVYTWRRRSTPYPMLATFDAPKGTPRASAGTGRTPRSRRS